MKNIVFIVVGLFLSLNLANANDLLFKASNGALNQNSVGVKKLTDEEMAQVKGGLVYSRGIQQFTSTNYQGHTIVTYYATVSLDQNEQRTQSIRLNNGRTNYDNYTSFIGYARGGTPIVSIHYNKTLGRIETTTFAFKSGSRVYFVADKLGRAIADECRAKCNF